MSRQLVMLGAGVVLALAAGGHEATARAAPADMLACRAIGEPARRLACYDALEADASAVSFEGHGNSLTPAFDITAPSRLHFENRDAVLVIYLLDAATGAVVQNLHRGGAGTGDFLIGTSGRYTIQVNATGGWRIRIAAP